MVCTIRDGEKYTNKHTSGVGFAVEGPFVGSAVGLAVEGAFVGCVLSFEGLIMSTRYVGLPFT